MSMKPLGAIFLFLILCGCQTAQPRRQPADLESARIPVLGPHSLISDLGPRLDLTLTQLKQFLLSQRKDSTYWSASFTSDVTSDAVTLALGQKLNKLTPDLRSSYADAISQRMEPNREGWPASFGGPIDFNVTGITLLCLKSAGVSENDSRFQTAWSWFDSQGGENHLSLYAKMMLSPLDLVAPDQAPSISPRVLGMPKFFPMHLDRVGFLRGLVVPSIGIKFLETLPDRALIADEKSISEWKSLTPEILDFHWINSEKEGSKKCKIPEESIDAFFDKVSAHPDLFRDCVFYPEGSGEKFKLKLNTFVREPLTEKLTSAINFVIDRTITGPKVFWAEQALTLELQLLNTNGAWYTMGFNLCGLRMLQEAQRVGLGNFQPQIDQAWQTLLNMRTKNQDSQLVQQWALTGIWDSADTLVAFSALQGTPWNLSDSDSGVTVKWLLDHAVISSTDVGSSAFAGVQRGWSFDENDSTLPDVDDTAMVLAALSQYPASFDSKSSQNLVLTEAVRWLGSRINHDGGYPAWATSVSRPLVQLMHQKMMETLGDFSQPDVTGRVLYSLSIAERALRKTDGDTSEAESIIQSVRTEGCKYLSEKMSKMKGQSLKLDPGNWMVNYVYSAASVLNGLAVSDCGQEKQQELAQFIVNAQQADGGWGESPTSYDLQSYVAAPPNSMQSAVAVAGLIAYYENFNHALPMSDAQEIPVLLVPAIEKGVNFLIEHTQEGTHPFDSEFNGVLIRGMTYARYELGPAYMSLYALARWKTLRPSILITAPAGSGTR